MMGVANAHQECSKVFAEADQTEDLEAVAMPTLILHGDHDQVVAIAVSAMRSAPLVKGAELKSYKGLSRRPASAS
jgi:non-heme chloroperoxidase